MPNGWRTINSLVHKIRLHGRRGKGMAESFSRQKSRHAPQKEGGLKILCDLPPVWPRLVRPTNLMSRMDGKKTHTHTHNAVIDIQSLAENTATKRTNQGLLIENKEPRKKTGTVSPTKRWEAKGDAPPEQSNSVCLVSPISKLVLLIDGRHITPPFPSFIARNTALSTSNEFYFLSTQHPSLISLIQLPDRSSSQDIVRLSPKPSARTLRA